MTAAIIIAKGHSRRLAGKNLLPFCGKPLFVWSVIQAQCSHLIDEVYVSTDSAEIAEVAEEAGAKVIERPVLHPDITASPIYNHAIREIQRRVSYGRVQGPLDIILSILPTSPLRHAYDFDESILLYGRLPEKKKQVWPLTPECETVVYKKTGPTTFDTIVGDKSWGYMTQGGAWNVISPEVYEEITQYGTNYDSVIDGRWAEEDEAARAHEDVATYYYALQPYQQFDIDAHDDFVICESIMQRMILVETDVYEKYKSMNILGVGNG
tara:strand:+ start:608 stop:1408 length:801 start_codon:yes stop_codon:yes gene_type:complete